MKIQEIFKDQTKGLAATGWRKRMRAKIIMEDF